MKKNEYESPDMEIVEMEIEGSILDGSWGSSETNPDLGTGDPGDGGF